MPSPESALPEDQDAIPPIPDAILIRHDYAIEQSVNAPTWWARWRWRRELRKLDRFIWRWNGGRYV